jgi:hypothetical protein
MMSTETEGLITPDFSQVQDGLEPGVYSVRIVDSKLDKWTGKDGKADTRLIVWTLETFNEAVDKNNGRKIFHRTPIEGAGAFRLQQLYKAAVGEELKGSFDRTMLHGRELEVTVAQQKNQPEYTEVKTVKQLTH